MTEKQYSEWKIYMWGFAAGCAWELSLLLCVISWFEYYIGMFYKILFYVCMYVCKLFNTTILLKYYYDYTSSSKFHWQSFFTKSAKAPEIFIWQVTR